MADVHQLFLLQEHGMFKFYKCCAECIGFSSLYVKVSINYPPGNNQHEASEVDSVVQSYYEGR